MLLKRTSSTESVSNSSVSKQRSRMEGYSGHTELVFLALTHSFPAVPLSPVRFRLVAIALI